jgi:hypothetical protein
MRQPGSPIGVNRGREGFGALAALPERAIQG